MTLKNAVTKGVKAWRGRRVGYWLCIDPKTGEYYLLTSANLAELNGLKAMYRLPAVYYRAVLTRDWNVKLGPHVGGVLYCLRNRGDGVPIRRLPLCVLLGRRPGDQRDQKAGTGRVYPALLVPLRADRVLFGRRDPRPGQTTDRRQGFRQRHRGVFRGVFLGVLSGRRIYAKPRIFRGLRGK